MFRKVRVGKFKGFKVELSPEQHASLIERYAAVPKPDTSESIVDGDSAGYMIDVPCVLCKEFYVRGNNRCAGCPFDRYKDVDYFACMKLMHDIADEVDEKIWYSLYISDGNIRWSQHRDKDARKLLAVFVHRLNKMKRRWRLK